MIRGGTGLTGIVLPDGTVGTVVGSGGVSMFPGIGALDGYDHAVSVGANGISLQGLESLPSGTAANYVVVGTNGVLYKSAGGGGGSDNFARYLARGSAEPGVDVRTPVGTPLWSPVNAQLGGRSVG